ncbi:c-type cytochrome, partial [Clostridium perfringens]|uniref:c-type cytochrome n=1 Tax=Clostridium perfringens TaxID=1502 RepID=UPI00375417A4
AVYVREGCVKCHGPEGRGDGESADSIKDQQGAHIYPQDYSRLATHSKAGADADDVFRVITTGLASMPSFAYLSVQERTAIVAWVRSRAFPPAP